MTSQAKINANRRNAGKSTGPRTEEGKAVVGQNAVTHGLTSRYDVLSFEDPAEYQQHRKTILEEFRPSGAFEALLVERIVSLSWRMQRADRLQGAAMEYLFTAEDRRGHFKGDPASGQVYRLTSGLVRDCANYRVVERLENSCHKTMAELLRRRKMRQDQGQPAPVERQAVASPSPSGKTKPTERLEPVGCRLEEGPDADEKTKPNPGDEAAGSAVAGASEEMPCGVTTNKCAKRSQFAGADRGDKDALHAFGARNRAETLLAEIRELRQTEPILAGLEARRTAWGRR